MLADAVNLNNDAHFKKQLVTSSGKRLFISALAVVAPGFLCFTFEVSAFSIQTVSMKVFSTWLNRRMPPARMTTEATAETPRYPQLNVPVPKKA